MTLVNNETLKIYNNIPFFLNDELLTLINLIKEHDTDEIPELNISINLQIYSLKKIEDKKREKKFFSLCLNDNQYKYNRFILMENELSNQLKTGNVINIKKINSKRVASGLYIMIKDFAIIRDKYNCDLTKIKLIKENDEQILIDEDGNNIEDIMKNKIRNDFDEESNDKKINENKNLILNFDCVIKILKELNKNNKKKNNKKKIIKKLDCIVKNGNDDEEKIIINEDQDKKIIYTSLKELTTFSRNFILLVRIIKKSEIKVFETRNTNNANILTGQGKLFYFIVIDQEGSEMQCTCFNKTVNKFYDLIQENHLYEIKGGYVKINDKKYTRIKADYKIVLDENSTITPKKDDLPIIIKKSLFNFVKISELPKLKVYTIIDICAIVLDITDIVVKITRNGAQPLRKLILGDNTKYKVELSLWRKFTEIEIKKGDIVLINNVKIGEYKGRNLSTFEETSIKINPNSADLDDENEEFLNNLIKFFEENKNNIYNNDFFSDFENLYKDKLQNYQMIEEDKTKYIKDILDNLDKIEESKNLSKISAVITQIIHNEKNFYIGCNDKNCKKKLMYDFSKKEYTCPSCGRKTKKVTYYYTLSLRVKDASYEYWIDLFGKIAENIMIYTAEEYKEFLQKRDQVKLKEISEKIEFKRFNFWVRPKVQVYNTLSKKKLYVCKIIPVDIHDEAYKISNYLKEALNIVDK